MGLVFGMASSKIKRLIKSKARWKVGNGTSVIFSEDKWIFKKPISTLMRFKPFKDKCILWLRSQVVDYWQSGNWLNLTTLDVIFSSLMTNLNFILLVGNELDRIIWEGSSSGSYLMPLGFSLSKFLYFLPWFVLILGTNIL